MGLPDRMTAIRIPCVGSRYRGTVFGAGILFYQSKTRLRVVLRPFLGSVGVTTHGKKTPFKRRAIEGRGFVVAFTVVPGRCFWRIGGKKM
jgi:hypothetical protein